MNKSKAIEQARIWINQKPMPQEINPGAVWKVLGAIGFELKGKSSDHTTFRWYHKNLLNDELHFKYGLLSLSVGHKKNQKSVLRVESVKKLINALKLYLDYEEK